MYKAIINFFLQDVSHHIRSFMALFKFKKKESFKKMYKTNINIFLMFLVLFAYFGVKA